MGEVWQQGSASVCERGLCCALRIQTLTSFTLVAELLKLCEVALNISSCFCTLWLWTKSRVQLEIGPTDFVLRLRLSQWNGSSLTKKIGSVRQTWALSSRTSPLSCCKTPRTCQDRRQPSGPSGSGRSTPRSASQPPLLLSSFSSLSSTSPTVRSSWRPLWIWWWSSLTDKILLPHLFLGLYLNRR